MSIGILITIGLLFLAIYGIPMAIRMKARFRFKLKRVLVGEGALFLGYLFARESRLSEAWSAGFALCFGVACAALLVKPPKVTRHIPAHVRREVIRRDLHGEPFDGKKHHLDHIVPLSKGGDNSVENLRVVAKEENLGKGAKMPRIRDLW